MSLDGLMGSAQMTAATYGYKIGDRVSFNGAEGVIVDITSDPYTLNEETPIIARFGRHTYHFTADGKLLPDMTAPCLTVTGSVKEKVKKFRWVYKDLWGRICITNDHLSENEAKSIHGVSLAQKIEVTEVEAFE